MLDSKRATISSSDSVAQEVKSVDILAALPTPPHNQNEDIRYDYSLAVSSTSAGKRRADEVEFIFLAGWKVMMKILQKPSSLHHHPRVT